MINKLRSLRNLAKSKPSGMFANSNDLAATIDSGIKSFGSKAGTAVGLPGPMTPRGARRAGITGLGVLGLSGAALGSGISNMLDTTSAGEKAALQAAEMIREEYNNHPIADAIASLIEANPELTYTIIRNSLLAYSTAIRAADDIAGGFRQAYEDVVTDDPRQVTMPRISARYQESPLMRKGGTVPKPILRVNAIK